MDKIRCTTSNSYDRGRQAVTKMWLKQHDIDYELKHHTAGCIGWDSLNYELTSEQLGELIAYLKEAEVLDSVSDIII